MGYAKQTCFRAVLACLALTFLGGAAWADDPFRLSSVARFSFGMNSGNLWLWGETLIPAGGRPGSGSKLDAQSELGIDQSEFTGFFLNGEILSKHFIDFDYLSYTPTGSRILKNTIRFHNRTYEAGSSIETKLDFNWSRLSYGYKVLDRQQFWVAPKIGVHYVRNTTSINGLTAEEGLASITRSLDGTYPVIGFDMKYLLPFGIDVGMDMEGIHLLSRGFLGMVRFNAKWELHPEMALLLSSSLRTVQYLEDNQPLNNEWTYTLLGWSAGIAFSF